MSQAEILAHRFLLDFSPEHRDKIASGGKLCLANANTFLAREGDRADAFYLIQTGHVAIELHDPGKHAALIQSVGPGEAVGWSWIVPPYRWEFDARAVEPVRCVRFDAIWLRELCDKDAALGLALLKHLVRIMAARLTSTRLQLLDLYR
jgi:CRP/FNR family transcriptional regulator, cyclic AMP receptor protein